MREKLRILCQFHEVLVV